MAKQSTSLFVLILSLVFIGCSKVNTDLIETPVEQGHFKVVLSNPTLAVYGVMGRAFWDQAAGGGPNAEGEKCEKQLNSVRIFVYHSSGADLETCLYSRNFTEVEIAKATAVFSLPADVYEPNESYDFYVIANYVGSDKPSRADLSAVRIEDLYLYYGLQKWENSGATAVEQTEFSKFYPDGASSDAVALRSTVDAGIGFVMSSDKISQTAPANNTPRKVDLAVSRLLSKVEVKTAATDDFFKNYIDKYGSKLTVDSVCIVNLVNGGTLIAGSVFDLVATNVRTVCQLPGSQTDVVNVEVSTGVTKIDNRVTYQNLFYSYQNAVDATTSLSVKRPQLQVYARFDFDGDNDPTDEDMTSIVYKKDLSFSGTKGALLRNTFYQVNVRINGLTEQEIVTTITVAQWHTLPVEDVDFGD